MEKSFKSKTLAIVLVAMMVISLFGNSFSFVYAYNANNAIIQLNDMSNVTDSWAIYKDNSDNVLGRIMGMASENGFEGSEGDVGTLSQSGNQNKFEWQGLSAGTYKFKAEVEQDCTLSVSVDGRDVTLTEVVDENNTYTFEVPVIEGAIVLINAGFSTNENQPPDGPDGPDGPDRPEVMDYYEVVAYFEGIEDGVGSDEEGIILMPADWTEGDVEFFVRTCKVDGELRAYHDDMPCDEDSYEELQYDIIGIANGEQINRTVTPSGALGDMKAVFTEEFMDYGKVTFHLGNGLNMMSIVSVVSEDLIFLEAHAPLEMSHSLGSVSIDNAILTNVVEGNVSIFFGNTQTTLEARGPKITKILEVSGAEDVEYDSNGTATITLPPLSVETTTELELVIELEDESTVTRKVNVVRTAIELDFNTADGNATLEAGYVVNKGYLYNNQDHDDEIFDAYLQVILYKDGVVAGYRQVQIDDEELINRLQEDESSSMELRSEEHIDLYGKDLDDTIEGVNNASVFLTNGPIDFDSDTLPSVEFGIGSGVTIEFGGEGNE